MRKTPGSATAFASWLLVAWVAPAFGGGPPTAIASARPVNEQVESDDQVKRLELAASARTNPELWYLLAEYCSEKANDASLSRTVARSYVIRGLEADDRALAMNGDYLAATRLKSVLLRQRMKYERDASLLKRLAAEADRYSTRADEIAERANQPRRVGPPRPAGR